MYQAFQHFITDAPWAADAVWRHLRATIPDRTVLDGTSFPKQGPYSVGVERQYCGALGKIANCQTAMTVALWTGAREWMLGATLHLPESWLTPAQRTRARIPVAVRGQPKWQLALTLLRQVRASGITVTAVLGDAECGESARLRQTLHRAEVPYALGVSSTLKIFAGTPTLVAPSPRAGIGRPRSRPTLAARSVRHRGARLGRPQPARTWRVVSWRNFAGTISLFRVAARGAVSGVRRTNKKSSSAARSSPADRASGEHDLRSHPPSRRGSRRPSHPRRAPPLRQVDPLIRQLTLYRDLIDRTTGDQ